MVVLVVGPFVVVNVLCDCVCGCVRHGSAYKPCLCLWLWGSMIAVLTVAANLVLVLVFVL